jgi:hypothetical protein
MTIALRHPGDLSFWWLLLALFLIIGIPALVLVGLAFAIYKGLSVKRETFTAINLEEDRGTTDASGDGADRA